jgi:Uma2 family endonuclease|tara:strand:- start:1105 stop:1209 length:105 start_codon:yes stop_codon:yes gene_type:complete
MKKFQKKFDFYATNVEIDEYIFGILKGSEVDIYI